MIDKDDEIKILLRRRELDWECIRAMQQRADKFLVFSIFWRKPWKSGHLPNWNSVRSVWDWIKYAHDCQDPAVACSCSGGFRFKG